MNYMCNIPKTPHIYYVCITFGDVVGSILQEKIFINGGVLWSSVLDSEKWSILVYAGSSKHGNDQ